MTNNRWKIIVRYIKVKLHLYKNRRFWRNYYKKHRDNDVPSSFAVFCFDKYLKPHTALLELGCGNGRDAFYFAKNDIDVTALDLENEEIKYLIRKNKYKNLKFLNKNFVKFRKDSEYDTVYSRFTIHSISEEDENETLKNAYNNLRNEGLFLIEVRSIKDNMFSTSEKLSDNEGATDHYRRFINFEEIKQKLENLNFSIIYSVESIDLAPYKDENPMIIRIVAKKTVG